MENSIKAGDVVVLAGDPHIRMTVSDVKDGEAVVLWFVGADPYDERIPVAALRKAE